VTGWCAPAWADSPRLSIPALPLPRALAELARQDNVAIGTEGALPDFVCPPISGHLPPARALERLLKGSGLRAQEIAPGVWRITARARVAAPARAVPPARPVVGETIVVSATKQAQTLGQVAQAITVLRLPLPGAAQAQMGTASVVANLDGLVLTALGPGRNRMFIDGVADSPFNGANQSPVAVYLDDTRLTYSAPDPDLRLVDVSRIEVLKGPQGALYGTGVLGGIYRVVTNRPDPDRVAASASLGVSTVLGGGTAPNGSAMVNLPLLAGRAALRVVAYGSDEPGWIDTGTRTDSNTTSVAGVRAAVALETGAWRIDASGMAQWINNADSQYAYAPGSRSRPAQLAEPHDNDLSHVALRVEGPAGGSHLVVTSAYTWHDVHDQLDATQGAASLGLANPALFADGRGYRVWDSEARLTGRWRGLHWLAGLGHVEAREGEDRNLSDASGTVSMVIDHTARVSHDTGLFFDGTVPITARLEIEGGGRLFHDSFTSARTADGAVTTLSATRDGFTPSAAIRWRPTPGRTLYLRFGSAFRQGGLNTQANGQISAYPGDQLTTFTAGWRQQRGAGGEFNAAGFVTLWDHMQSDILLANGLIETRTAGRARIAGLELSLKQPLGEHWRIEGGGTAQSALLVRNDLGVALEDTRLPSIPDYTLRLAVERRWPIGAAQSHVRLALNQTGPSRLSFQPGIDRKMGKVLDSRIEWGLDWPRTRLALAVSNPLARSGNLFAYGNPFRLAVPEFTPQRPPAFTLTLSRDF